MDLSEPGHDPSCKDNNRRFPFQHVSVLLKTNMVIMLKTTSELCLLPSYWSSLRRCWTLNKEHKFYLPSEQDLDGKAVHVGATYGPR